MSKWLWNSRMQALLVSLSAGLMITGCSGGRGHDAPETFSVSGTVSLDGDALPDATVTFLPLDVTAGLQPASGRTSSNGSYRLRFNASQAGAQVGAYKVAISASQQNEDGEVTSPETLPAVYNQQTELTANVSEDNRTFDFALKSDAGPVPTPRVEQ